VASATAARSHESRLPSTADPSDVSALAWGSRRECRMVDPAQPLRPSRAPPPPPSRPSPDSSVCICDQSHTGKGRCGRELDRSEQSWKQCTAQRSTFATCDEDHEPAVGGATSERVRLARQHELGQHFVETCLSWRVAARLIGMNFTRGYSPSSRNREESRGSPADDSEHVIITLFFRVLSRALC
jgi:hypothetical protein